MLSRSDIEDPYSQAVEGKPIHSCLHDNSMYLHTCRKTDALRNQRRASRSRAQTGFFENGDFAWEVCKKWQDGDVERTC